MKTTVTILSRPHGEFARFALAVLFIVSVHQFLFVAEAGNDDDSIKFDLRRAERLENVPKAFDDNLSSGKVVDLIVQNKQKDNADVIKRLEGERKNAKRNSDELKRQLKAMHADPERRKRITGSDAPVKHSTKAYAEDRLRQSRAAQATAEKNLASARQQRNDTQARQQAYNRASKAAGLAGRAISVYDAYKKSHVEDDAGNKVFSVTRFGVNAFKNLSGIAGLESAYTNASEVKEREFLMALDKYEKAGMDITNPDVITLALMDATEKALLVGAYEGAKCIPLVGDAINVYEISESSIGLVYDTLQSQRMREEGTAERKEQALDSIPRLQAMLKDMQAGRELFDTQRTAALEVLKEYRKLKNSYLEVDNRADGRTDKLKAFNELDKACEAASQITDENYLNILTRTSRQYDQAVKSSITLAGNTLASYRDGSADGATLQKTKNELQEMTKALETCKVECDKALGVLDMLAEGGGLVDKHASQLIAAATEDARLYEQLADKAADMAESYASMVARCERIIGTQQQIKPVFEKAFDYFSFRVPDDASSKKMINIKNDFISATVKQYELDELRKIFPQLAEDLKSSERPLPVAEGISEKSAQTINKGAKIRPGIAELSRSLESRIREAKNMLARLESPGQPQLQAEDTRQKEEEEKRRRQAEVERARRAREQANREAEQEKARREAELERFRRAQEQARREQSSDSGTMSGGDIKVVKPAPQKQQQPAQQPQGDIEWKIEYYSPGKVRVKVPFSRKSGKMHGTSTSYYSTGQVEETLTYTHGDLNGPHFRYHSNGNKMTQTQYVNGKENGSRLSYHENGQLYMDYAVVNGDFHGAFKVYFPNGKLQNDGVMDRGNRDWIKVYNQNGDLIGEYRREWGN